MLTFFKNFGKGIIYVLVLPFLLVGLAIYAVVALFVFIYLTVKGLILFFTGRSLYEDLPEDREAKKRIAFANGATIEDIVGEKENEETEHEEVEEAPKEEEGTSIERDPFYVPEYMRTEEQQAELDAQKDAVRETINEPQIDEPIKQDIKEEFPIDNAPGEEIIVQKNTQNAAILDISDENDDNSEDSGVNIDFE